MSLRPAFLKETVFLLVGVACFNCTQGQPLVLTIDPAKKAQTIDNIGASGAWYSEGIGKYWPAAKKERMAELLFSKAFSATGNPLGIGLSAWRFNIGGGTAEQGDSSGISDPPRRVECFLSPDGTWDWSKQAGYLWFVRKAKDYGVENLVAFSNTPPVQFTKNGLGFRLQKDYVTNLREDCYGAYAGFLATVLRHFDSTGLHFHYISPVNEPQWDWSGRFGHMGQEGSPWRNEAIYRTATSLDSALAANHLSTQIIMPEAGILTALYEGKGDASRQVQQFFAPGSPYYLGRLTHLKPIIAGHSYFTEAGDTALLNIRHRLSDTANRYNTAFWQSEYSMLGDGYKDGKKGRSSAMDCALFLAKVIHHDLTASNATAWHFWNAWEPGSANEEVRYNLLALKTNPLNTEGDFTITKNLWALGHYSRFVRPGMQRVAVQRNDALTEMQVARAVMASAYVDEKTIVVVAINYTETPRTTDLAIAGGKVKSIRQYLTTATPGNDMKAISLSSAKGLTLPARSISTFVIARH